MRGCSGKDECENAMDNIFSIGLEFDPSTEYILILQLYALFQSTSIRPASVKWI